jgi:L-ascorbate metabolism protein UlaG (beta-lactamase superfamily)
MVMDIIPLGHASFKLKGKKATVITDPFDPDKVGLKFPKHTSADIVTISHAHPDHNFGQIVENPEGGEKIIFDGPGEYESKAVEIIGIPTSHDTKEGSERGKNTMYRIDIDGISVLHCGDLGHKLTEAQIEQIDSADVLMIPVGGFYTIDAHVAAEVVKQLEPFYVIPMHYNRPGLDPKIFGNLQPVEAFLKEMGLEHLEPQPKLTVSKDKLIAESTQVVILE